jgi:hypothetical protein
MARRWQHRAAEVSGVSHSPDTMPHMWRSIATTKSLQLHQMAEALPDLPPDLPMTSSA